jgi:CheY-like chemotaxis protein
LTRAEKKHNNKVAPIIGFKSLEKQDKSQIDAYFSMETKKKILLVEDDSDLRIFYAELLSEQYQVESAVDGEDGFAKVLAQKFDLILLDLIMPRLDGLGFLKRKKDTSAIAKVPVVIMTNIGQEDILKECFELGAKCYIMKVNTTPDKVLAIISQALGNKCTETVD